ncbi:hypothetical protein [Cecembia lonarensis]|uniref:G:T/U mismatch-specific DNA glycosylase n=1 Tax=Cecembia lonarensis (strain CCUG 58316 / KCTC 22772 / LW9) TaxID=1225176 RepID=K1L024_CECL9|nr:hypothetical protein [Cecembia lonarensis]EKB48131.1 hypothetical protein B879_03268 [Cecembia lonarensis LW9]
MKKRHPFKPIIFQHSKSMLIGTLPPETTPFYFSNTSKTRLWDILYAIDSNESTVPKNKYLISDVEKIQILNNLSLSLADIILEYDRRDMNSVQDSDIIPYAYLDIKSLIEDSQITKLLFLYKNAALWFLHSLKEVDPVPINQIRNEIHSTEFLTFNLNGRDISCTVLPMPLNRGKKAETMIYKLGVYRELIQV